MRSFLAALRSLTLPWGRTTGNRIVLNGVDGLFQVIDSNDNVVVEINTQDIVPGLKVFNPGAAPESYIQLFETELFILDAAGTFGVAGTLELTCSTWQYQNGTGDNPAIIEYDGSGSDPKFVISAPWVATTVSFGSPDISGAETWQPFTFNNALAVPWTNTGAPWSNCQYRRMPDGTVRLRGVVNMGTKANGTIFATLPAGYRPPGDKHIPLSSDILGQTPVVVITSGGDMKIFRGAGSNNTAFDGITFETELG